VRAYIDKSGETIQWLEDKGLVFDCIALYYGQWPLVWHRPRGLCAEMIKLFIEECRKMGVRILTSSPAKKLLMVENRIKGVLAEVDGGEVEIDAPAVIIASGGYGGNKELLKKYCWYYNDNLHLGGLPHTGDGLIMAMEVGAATEDLGFLLRGGLPGPGFGVPRVLDEPYMVRVDPKGKRFIDETICGLQHAYTANESIQTTYIIFDHSMMKRISQEGTIYLVGKDRMNRYIPIPDLEKELRTLAEKGSMVISDSWDDIAKYIGCDTDVLKNTINEYNHCRDKGHDPVFAKDPRYLVPLRTPPYYVIGGSIKPYLDTIGGIKINEYMEVLDRNDDPIPGLYAAGVCAGGWQAVDYNGLHMSGSAVGFAVNSGRIAAENVALYISRKTLC